MKRILLALLCLGVLGTATGCYIDPAAPGVTSFEVGVGATYQEEVPYWSPYPYGYYRDDERRYRRWERRRERWRERRYRDD